MISFDKALKSNELLFYIFSSDKYLLEKCNNLINQKINEVYNNQFFLNFIQKFEAHKSDLFLKNLLIKNSINEEIEYIICEKKEKAQNINENIIEVHEKFNYLNQQK